MHSGSSFYHIPELQPGNYSPEITARNYSPELQPGITANVVLSVTGLAFGP